LNRRRTDHCLPELAANHHVRKLFTQWRTGAVSAVAEILQCRFC
jgi:hypothetical protein